MFKTSADSFLLSEVIVNKKARWTISLSLITAFCTWAAPSWAGPGDVFSTNTLSDLTYSGLMLDDEDGFGRAIANLGDMDNDGFPEIAIGAAFDLNGGAVHIIFLGANGMPKNTVEINSTTAPGLNVSGGINRDGDQFGISVANIGDLDGDGVQDLAVGASRDDEGGVNRGAVHILFLDVNGLPKNIVEINDATLNNLANQDQFGASVAGIGDLDSNGVPDIAVGALGDAGKGAVYILFLDMNGSVINTNKIDESDVPLLGGDQFGVSLANLGDLDGDGVTDLVVGAIGDDAGGDTRGAVHIIFLNSNGTVKGTVEINGTTPGGPILSNNNLFGYSVANLGDLNCDQVQDIAVGAIFDSDDGHQRGATHVIFLNANGTPQNTTEINASTPNGPNLSDSDRFGSSIANLGDLDGDDIQDIAVGATGGEGVGTDRGEVHFLFLQGGQCCQADLADCIDELEKLTAPQRTLGSVMDAIDAIAADPNASPSDAQAISSALKHLEKAEVKLASSDLISGIAQIKKALNEMNKAVGVATQHLQQQIVEAVQARVADVLSIVADLPQSNPGKVQRAQDKLNEGDSFLALGDFVKALKAYKEAVKKASGAG